MTALDTPVEDLTTVVVRPVATVIVDGPGQVEVMAHEEPRVQFPSRTNATYDAAANTVRIVLTSDPVTPLFLPFGTDLTLTNVSAELQRGAQLRDVAITLDKVGHVLSNARMRDLTVTAAGRLQVISRGEVTRSVDVTGSQGARVEVHSLTGRGAGRGNARLWATLTSDALLHLGKVHRMSNDPEGPRRVRVGRADVNCLGGGIFYAHEGSIDSYYVQHDAGDVRASLLVGCQVRSQEVTEVRTTSRGVVTTTLAKPGGDYIRVAARKGAPGDAAGPRRSA